MRKDYLSVRKHEQSDVMFVPSQKDFREEGTGTLTMDRNFVVVNESDKVKLAGEFFGVVGSLDEGLHVELDPLLPPADDDDFQTTGDTVCSQL